MTRWQIYRKHLDSTLQPLDYSIPRGKRREKIIPAGRKSRQQAGRMLSEGHSPVSVRYRRLFVVPPRHRPQWRGSGRARGRPDHVSMGQRHRRVSSIADRRERITLGDDKRYVTARARLLKTLRSGNLFLRRFSAVSAASACWSEFDFVWTRGKFGV